MRNPSFEEACIRLMVAEVTTYNTNDDYADNVEADIDEDNPLATVLANRAVEQAVALQNCIRKHYKTEGEA